MRHHVATVLRGGSRSQSHKWATPLNGDMDNKGPRICLGRGLFMTPMETNKRDGYNMLSPFQTLFRQDMSMQNTNVKEKFKCMSQIIQGEYKSINI